MLEITTAPALKACIESHPYFVFCAHIPALEPSSVLLTQLGNLAVVTSGIVFGQADFTLASMRTFKTTFGVTRFPSLIFVAHGDIKEITIGDDMDGILSTLAKWYKTVYSPLK